MDLNLFGKYAAVLVKQKNKKDEIIECIEKETGITFFSEEIVIQKQIISFQTSSVKKMMLRKKSCEEALKEKGYSVKF
jgi:hypothetical protein